MGKYPLQQTNEAYEKNEASLIAKNGDQVSDLLYTTKFRISGLTWSILRPEWFSCTESCWHLSGILMQDPGAISQTHELNGRWMRAFDFDKFEHRWSNADAGWGA